MLQPKEGQKLLINGNIGRNSSKHKFIKKLHFLRVPTYLGTRQVLYSLINLFVEQMKQKEKLQNYNEIVLKLDS